MRVYKTIEYQDADGNRGIPVTNVELESEDREMILDAVYDQCPEILEEEPVGGTVDITLIDPYTEEDIEVEIDLGEWI